MEKIIAAVVTYNRKEMLVSCLKGLLGQTRIPDKILIINNASTDGTAEELEESGFLKKKEILLINMEKNTGGAGGFYEAIKFFLKEEGDWLWVMDDDVLPEKDALEKLLDAKDGVDREASFYASVVYGTDGEPMNLPTISQRKTKNGYQGWDKYLPKGCVEISDATFVSILINKEAIKTVGLPCRDYFLWGNDSEYTLRLTHYFGPAYLVGASMVLHKRTGSGTLDIRKETSKERVRFYRHFYENLLINRRLYLGKVAFLVSLMAGIRNAFGSIGTKYGWCKFFTVFRGIAGHFYRIGKVKRYIRSQVMEKRTGNA